MLLGSLEECNLGLIVKDVARFPDTLIKVLSDQHKFPSLNQVGLNQIQCKCNSAMPRQKAVSANLSKMTFF